MSEKTQQDLVEQFRKRLHEINELIYEVAAGNFHQKLELSPDEDELDGLIGGINMLGEELESSTVSRDYMESIYRGIVDILFVLDAGFCVQRVNEPACNILGFSEEELLGKHFDLLVDGDHLAEYYQMRDRVMADASVLNFEIGLLGKNSIIPASASFSTLHDNQKRVTGFLMIAKDIRKIKETEQELITARINADMANQSKTNFLANMSHEIRTPLNGIMGFTNLLLESPEATEAQRYYLKLMKESGDSLTTLLNDIIDLSKVEQGKLSLEHIHFNIRETVEKTLHPYHYLATEKGLLFQVDFDKNIPQYVAGDPSRLSQIIRNLATNAIKFTESGSILLSFRFEPGQNGQFKLMGMVTDTGIGIPPEKHDLIFESFTQSDNSTTRKYGGSGLGLTITRYLTELMGGTISVESPVNKDKQSGSTFRFSIFLAVGSPLAAPLEPAAKKLIFAREYQVLAVDDNQINLILAKKVIESLGGYTDTAVNGEEAVKLAQERPYDLILMDLQMPGIDGYEATRQIRALGFKRPIIALSANTFEEHIKDCLAAGMNAHVRKPFTKMEIFNTIENLMAAWQL